MGLNFGQELFPPRGELLVNFDWIDIADGTGYVTYYGGVGDNGEYFVTPSNQISSERIKVVVVLSGSLTQEFEEDFDIVFNTPKIVNGKIYISVPMGVVNTSTQGYSATCYLVATVYHYDGTTETSLGSGQSRTISIDDVDKDDRASEAHMATCVIDVAQTHFKKGETLRITLEGWFNGDANLRGGIGIDPTNRTDFFLEGVAPIFRNYLTSGGTTSTPVNTRMTFQVPYKLNL